MERKITASFMAIIMIVSMYFLAREAAIRTISNEKNEKVKGTIVLDAGHGGSDPGKVGVHGELEKDINLSIALKLKDKLEAAGFVVIMTRTGDSIMDKEEDADQYSGKAADMHKRIAIINDSNADFLVSIHQNSFGNAQVRGPQVFYFHSSDEGMRMASQVQKKLNEGMDIQKPRVEKANDNYYLLKRSEIPAIIIECGFLSNAEEAYLLSTEEYQDKLVTCIVDSILQGNIEKEPEA